MLRRGEQGETIGRLQPPTGVVSRQRRRWPRKVRLHTGLDVDDRPQWGWSVHVVPTTRIGMYRSMNVQDPELDTTGDICQDIDMKIETTVVDQEIEISVSGLIPLLTGPGKTGRMLAVTEGPGRPTATARP